MRLVVLIAVLVLGLLTGCSGDDDSSAAPSRSAASIDVELRDELVAMLDEVEAQRTGDGSQQTDADRTVRLKEIIEEHGWPGYDLVGKKGEDAAWAIAQHSDLDPTFQAEALELMRAAVDDGQASPGNLAYLEDRVAVGQGRPQRYGTQVMCGDDGPEPTTPIEDASGVEALRAEAGLEPLADYIDEMAAICSHGMG